MLLDLTPDKLLARTRSVRKRLDPACASSLRV